MLYFHKKTNQRKKFYNTLIIKVLEGQNFTKKLVLNVEFLIEIN